MRRSRRVAIASVAVVVGSLAPALTGPAPHGIAAETGVCPVFVDVSLGQYHGLGLTADGEVWSWGFGYDGGQLGHGPELTETDAYPVRGLHGVTDIAAGERHSLAISAGLVYGWGNNSEGQLGDGSTTGRSRPVRVSGLVNATDIAAGYHFSLARTADGGVSAWGFNAYGQLGDGTTTSRSIPVSVFPPGSGFTSIAAGSGSSLAVAYNRSMVWGNNSSGQLGNSSTTNQHVPEQSSLIGVTAFASGANHSLAVGLQTAATGNNTFGALGDGTTTSRSSWDSISGLGAGHAIGDIAAGSYFSMAVVDGTLMAWGWNGYGQLGDGTTTSRATPAPVPGIAGHVTQIAAYGVAAAAVVNGGVKIWGNGQLTPADLQCSARPAVETASGPGAVVAGSPAVFSAPWTSTDPAHTARLVVCRTPSHGPDGCAGGAWASGEISAARPAVATFTPTHADVGTHPFHAYVCDDDAACAPPVSGTFQVLPAHETVAFPSDSCDIGGTNVVSGFIEDAYLKARFAPGADPGATSVCVAAENGGTHVGGRITIDDTTPGTPVDVDVDDDAASVQACGTNANNVSVQSGTVLGGQPYWVHVTPTPVGSTDAAWVCIRFTNTLGVRLRFATGSISMPGAFAADPPTPHVPAYASGLWPSAGPSAACAAAVGGSTRYADLRVGAVPVALYGWAESPTRTHLCVRGGTAGGAGGRLTVDSAGVPTVTTGTTTAPCPFDVVTRADAPSYGVYLSNPATLPALPASACVSVAGTSRSATVTYSGAAVATWSPDPA